MHSIVRVVRVGVGARVWQGNMLTLPRASLRRSRQPARRQRWSPQAGRMGSRLQVTGLAAAAG